MGRRVVMREPIRLLSWVPWLFVLWTVACAPANSPEVGPNSGQGRAAERTGLIIPPLQEVSDQGRAIQVVTTTGIIGDVAKAIAGEDAEVVALMAPNQDPHSYQITAGDLKLVANADAVLVNGWQLEEGLIADLENAAGDVPLVPVSAGIEPRVDGDDQTDGEALPVDPHVWLAPLNVIHWVDNIEHVFSVLDPANSESYAQRAQDYRTQLRELDRYVRRQLDTIDNGRRVLVTNHDAFGHFADVYEFKVVGTILPGNSALAEPSSQNLAALVDRMQETSTCAIFVEHSASQRLATQLADELEHCDRVQVVTLYSGALGEAGSGADTYLTMIKANVDMIVDALEPGTLGSKIN